MHECGPPFLTYRKSTASLPAAIVTKEGVSNIFLLNRALGHEFYGLE